MTSLEPSYLKNRIENVIFDKNLSNDFFLKNFLYLISILYGGVVKIKSDLYQHNIFSKSKLPCKVISIGNLSVGGTGKTPTTIYVAEYLKNSGYHTVVISRGYKGSNEKLGGVVSTGKNILMGPKESGDEPFMIAKCLTDVPVLIGKNRFQIGMHAIKEFNPDVIVFDDAFQHLKLARDINLLLLDYSKPFGNRYLFPRGILREPVSSMSRSDAIILTRSDNKSNYKNINFSKSLSVKPVFKSCYVPYIKNVIGENSINKLSDLRDSKVFVFSGLARNEDFHKSLINTGCIIKGSTEFQDHHPYSEKDFEKINESAKNTKAEIMITTEKDFVKLSDRISSNIPLVVLGIKVSFGETASAFEKFIKNRLEVSN